MSDFEINGVPVKFPFVAVWILIDKGKQIEDVKIKLEAKTKMNLSNYVFWLQQCRKLERSQKLADLCTSENVEQIQINVLIFHSEKSINILDIVKPTELYENITNRKWFYKR